MDPNLVSGSWSPVDVAAQTLRQIHSHCRSNVNSTILLATLVTVDLSVRRENCEFFSLTLEMKYFLKEGRAGSGSGGEGRWKGEILKQ